MMTKHAQLCKIVVSMAFQGQGVTWNEVLLFCHKVHSFFSLCVCFTVKNILFIACFLAVGFLGCPK